MQHELPASTLVELAYAGSRGTHLIGFGYDLNQLDPQYLALGLALDDRVPNPFFGAIPPGTPLSGATIARSQALKPYPAYLTINVANPPLGRTSYHSGQVKMERRFSKGLGFLGAYTFSEADWRCGKEHHRFRHCRRRAAELRRLWSGLQVRSPLVPLGRAARRDALVGGELGLRTALWQGRPPLARPHHRRISTQWHPDAAQRAAAGRSRRQQPCGRPSQSRRRPRAVR